MALRLSRLYYPKGESAFDINSIDLVPFRKLKKIRRFSCPNSAFRERGHAPVFLFP